jgi:hypothetical protein
VFGTFHLTTKNELLYVREDGFDSRLLHALSFVDFFLSFFEFFSIGFLVNGFGTKTKAKPKLWPGLAFGLEIPQAKARNRPQSPGKSHASVRFYEAKTRQN